MEENELNHFSIPHLLHIEMTYSCNAKCFFCYNPSRNSPIDYEQILKLVKSVAKSKVPHVYLIGGEPSLLEVEKLNNYIDILSSDSSLTIVTNGLKYMDGLSSDLACLGVAIHGDAKTQEWLSGIKGGYDRTVENVKRYVKDGFDVRCIPVLTSKNYDQIYDIIKLAKEVGMESVFVDKFEIGGMGLDMAGQLKPSLEQFKISLDQMIKARDDFNIPVGFGTAIPYCLDERLIKENMFANCGVGVTFAAVNPNGDFRICNQSEIVYGNILEESVEEIWNKKDIEQFRNLKWANEPCKDCVLLTECTGGCKVDLSCSSTYCIDYHIRENREELVSIEKVEKLWKEHEKEYERKLEDVEVPEEYREFFVDKCTKLNNSHKEKYVVTRYQTVVVNDEVYKIVEEILNGLQDEEAILEKFSDDFKPDELRKLLSQLETIEAIHTKKIKSVDWEITRDCNLECKHCITSSPIKIEYRGLGQIIRVINKLCDIGLEEISFTGGEPLTYPYLKELLEYLEYKDLSARFITNGTMLTEELLESIKDCVSEIGISLDGTAKNINDSIRGEGSFEKVMKSIELLKNKGIPFSLYFTMHKKNNDIEDMIKFSKEVGAEYCKINEITQRGRALKNSDLFTDVEYKIPDGEKISEKCDLDNHQFFINPCGDCFPCVELSQNGGYSIGNVFEDDLNKIYERLNSYVKKNSGQECPYTIWRSDKYATICTNNKLNCCGDE